MAEFTFAMDYLPNTRDWYGRWRLRLQAFFGQEQQSGLRLGKGGTW